MKQRIYIDTSVIGGCFDDEFSYWSNLLFNEFVIRKKNAVISRVTLDELSRGPKYVNDILKKIPEENIEILEITNDAIVLAEKYIKSRIVTKKYYDDALHIAIASIFKVDILVSWNFKHIVNIRRINKYNAINLLMDYKQLEIRTPKEVIDYE